MSTKRIELAIPAPCQQRWQDMKPEESGRFCDSCQKTVVDFTAMTDQQIGAYFSNQPNNVCGRFAASQLNRDVVLSQNISIGAVKQRWLGLMTAGLLSWSSTQGQSTQVLDKNVSPNERIVAEYSALADSIVQHKKSRREDSTWEIVGRVITERKKEPIPGTTIQTIRINRKNLGTATNAKGLFRNLYTVGAQSDFGTVTDANGLFRLQVPYYKEDSLIIKVGMIGYISKEIEINPTHKLPIVISLADDVLGELVCIRKPNFFQRLKNRLRASH